MRFARITAFVMALLLMAIIGGEVLLCGFVAHSRNEAVASEQSDEDCGCTDGCLCCCSHVMPAPNVMTLAMGEPVPTLLAEPLTKAPEHKPSSIYHPPRV